MENRNPDGTLKKGAVLNPKGRPVGARSKLQESFLADCYKLWQDKGMEALELMAAEKPNEFCRMIASLMPKELEINDMSDAERAIREASYEQLQSVILAADSMRNSRAGAAGTSQKGRATKSSELH